ncbi:MAG TPA: amidohydrolase family protein, partial [Dehalococcoidia bacterium]|nr:amidohydrolase family protein [Dehalococcoidia bacterium]
GGRWGPSHETCLEQAQRYEDLFIPAAVVDPGETEPERIDELYAMGYRGLKIIGTARAYDDRSYFPVYERAQANHMPILFHCGVIGGPIDLRTHHPRRDPESANRLLAFAERLRGMGVRDVGASRMRPFHLDTIANNFPELPIIGAHLGGTGNYDEAASVARWRLNVAFDMSGGEVIERHAVERRLIGFEITVEKLMFGSDCAADDIQDHVDRFQSIFDELGLDDDARERIWYGNAAEMFGLQEPAWAAE